MKIILPALLIATISSSQAWIEGKSNKDDGEDQGRKGIGSTALSENDVAHIPAESRIVGGSNAEVGKYPFFVSWGGCGASLIGKDTLLTAAHCEGIFTNQVKIGESRKFGNVGRGIQRNIVQRVPHPSYSDYTVNYDFMVMKLDEPVDTDEYPPVELNGNGVIPMDEQILTVIGFGSLSQGSSSTPARLQEVAVNYIPTDTCNGRFSYNGQIEDETMFCAGIEGGGKDSCQGDSGGPIFNEIQDGRFEQVGIVSWGQGCAQRNYPGVYSRVSGVIDWIQTQVCDVSDFKPAYCDSQGGDDSGSGSGSGGGSGNSPEPPLLSPPLVPAPPEGTVPVRLDIIYDQFESEVEWEFEQNGQTILSKNDFDNISSTGIDQTYRVNLVPGDAVFTITDTNGDGICCSHGIGSYQIVAETFIGEIPLTISSGQYQYEEVKYLSVPSLGLDDPSGDDDDDDNNSFPAPLPPTTIIVPLPTTIVPPADNQEEEVSVRLDITYDRYPLEVGWSFEQNGNTVLTKNAGDITQAEESSDQSYLVSMAPGAAKFTISDTSGDGICCSYDRGKYEIFVETSNGNDVSLFSSNGDYDSVEEVELTIPSNGSNNDNQTNSPSSAPDDNSINPPSLAPAGDNESVGGEFYVDENVGNRSCDWLSDNIARYGYLCAFFDVALKCPRLCDTCQYFES